MTELNEFTPKDKDFDALDQVLAGRPALKAPRHTSSNVLARIASLPQTAPIAAGAVLTTARYAAPVARPLPEPFEAELDEQHQRRLLVGFIFASAWLGLFLLMMWAIWPAISNLVFGPSSDLQMQSQLAALQGVWDGVVGFLFRFVTTYATLLPTLLSAAIGLALMTTLLFSNTVRRTFQAE